VPEARFDAPARACTPSTRHTPLPRPRGCALPAAAASEGATPSQTAPPRRRSASSTHSSRCPVCRGRSQPRHSLAASRSTAASPARAAGAPSARALRRRRPRGRAAAPTSRFRGRPFRRRSLSQYCCHTRSSSSPPFGSSSCTRAPRSALARPRGENRDDGSRPTRTPLALLAPSKPLGSLARTPNACEHRGATCVPHRTATPPSARDRPVSPERWGRDKPEHASAARRCLFPHPKSSEIRRYYSARAMNAPAKGVSPRSGDRLQRESSRRHGGRSQHDVSTGPLSEYTDPKPTSTLDTGGGMS